MIMSHVAAVPHAQIGTLPCRMPLCDGKNLTQAMSVQAAILIDALVQAMA